MITIENAILKKQKNFWNNCLFHPTDAVEDPWGKRILDQMAKDGAVQTVRIYSMFEDIVYLDGNGNLCCDFRISDLRLDYLNGYMVHWPFPNYHPPGCARDYRNPNSRPFLIDEFMETYDVKEGDGMYLAPEDRITIW